ncbi:LOW QUALITY PROTEIN: MAPK regulated corepressor interacting protein 2 [Rhopalosiphum padi]|uniref:LOW QUALITY PROTEIN: MAPK regulated corepressor interacting protein 2 n=1 Tax=Rhopalosiphum padi TaxID=40932 RepID=UPI00298E109A|nr:LOW QUALITY PROTEIN: MAPK regulated corepressor interacting protein 2 [Rhopalosiphum padi]
MTQITGINNTFIMGRRLTGPSARTRDAQPLPLTTQHNSSTTNDRNNLSQHDELIHFVGGSWNVIFQEYQNGCQGSNGRFHIQFYEEGNSDTLKGFKPFDLEAWWGKQTIQRYQQRS